MTDQEKIDDYDRLRYEYSQVHQKYRRVLDKEDKAKQLNILDVSKCTWTVKEIVDELEGLDAIKEAKYFFDKYSC